MTITTRSRLVGIAGAFVLGGAVFVPAAAFAATDSSTVSATIAECTAVAATITVSEIGALSFDTTATENANDGRLFFGAQNVGLMLDTGSKVEVTDCVTPLGGLFFEHTPFMTDGAVSASADTTVTIATDTGFALGGATAKIADYTGFQSLLFDWQTEFADGTPPGVYSSTATFTLTVD